MINVTTPAALAAANGPTVAAMPVIAIGSNGEIIGSTVSGTPTRTSVGDTAASAVALLVANADRKPGSLIVNDSTAVLYIGLDTPSTLTAYECAIDGKTTVPGIYYVPDGWLGSVWGLWSSDAGGNARITEFA